MLVEEIYAKITNKDLETAAEMFIYLNACPGNSKVGARSALQRWFQAWFKFYSDLFKTQPPDLIILTLNRMMTSLAPKNIDFERNKKLFNRISSLLQLKYKKIQNLLLPRKDIKTFNEGDAGEIKMSFKPHGNN